MNYSHDTEMVGWADFGRKFDSSDFVIRFWEFDIARTENGRLTSFEERRETEGKSREVLPKGVVTR